MKKDRNNEGIGFFGLLFIVFLVLKLTKVINWSWWWITSPLWIPFAVVIVIVILTFLVSFLTDVFKRWKTH